MGLLRFKDDFLAQLVTEVPTLLASQDPKTGRFGTGVWIVTDQNVLFPLATAFAHKHPKNPFYQDPKVLAAVIRGGDALIDDQDEKGMWVFRKKDNSTWGKILMPWTYSRWIRAFGLVRHAMSADARARGEKALRLGYSNIAAGELKRVHNIPTHHAMGLYHAGQLLGEPAWCAHASAFFAQVVKEQDPAGFWSENSGPVVGYNAVYVDAVGVYYALSQDKTVLPALERAARFHALCTYPDGSAVETVDERQEYSVVPVMPNAGFSFSPLGRGYVARQIPIRVQRGRKTVGADLAASYLRYGEEGETEEPVSALERGRQVIGKNDALVAREKPWFVALSAYHAFVPQSRWIQDRQNLVSVFCDGPGLILGGGNTKLTPLWSTFTVGDTALLLHKPGDENPDFKPRAGLFHVPSEAKLDPDALSLTLTYGPATCRVRVEPTAEAATLTYEVLGAFPSLPVEGHLPLLVQMSKAWKSALGKKGKLSATALVLTAEEAGGWLEHAGWRITLPAGSRVAWPILPHDQYKKDGSAALALAKLVLTLPLTAAQPRLAVTITRLSP